MVQYQNIVRKLALLSLLLAGKVYGQVTLSGPVTTAQTITAPHSITLNPNFSANGANGMVVLMIVGSPVQNCVQLAATPSQDQNYIQTLTPRQPFNDASALASKTTCEVMQAIQYIDGLGRPLQIVQVKANPDATKDMVQPIAYDQFGREAVKYLPYPITAGIPGSYRPNALVDGSGNYSGSEQYGFYHQPQASVNYLPINIPSAPTAFEASPLNRVVEQGAPGADWQLGGHTNRIIYATNNGTAYWAKQFAVSIDASGNRTLIDQDTYVANQLYVTVSQNENWPQTQSTDVRLNTTEEYKDKEGHVVLKRTYNMNGSTFETLSTYYVYDDFGNLCFVLPPKAEADAVSTGNPITQTTLTNLCYQYTYDERNRLSSKQLPGKGWEYTVYNTLDQVVATQDANMRFSKQWIITKYDALGRAVITGIWNNGNLAISRTSLQANVNAQTTQWEVKDNAQMYGYTLTNTYPSILNKVLSINYYDDYNIPNLPTPYDQHANYSSMTKGLLTATKTNILDENDMLWTVTYYDDKGRATHVYAQHYKGGVINTANYDHIANTYDFTNAVTNTTRTHYTAAAGTNPALTVANAYVYDHMGRKRQTWSRINNITDSVLLSQNDYNEIGQELTKHLHSTDYGASFLQNVGYAYNERGWMTQSTSNLFTEQLRYNTQSHGATLQYNGNIAEQEYTGTHTGSQWTSYGYDALNRLTNANSSAGLNENNISYDKMGNILSLTRAGNTLNYTYNGNQLTNLSGMLTGSQTYDPNGNLEFDYRSDRASGFLDFDHNILNLVSAVGGGQDMVYDYTASGEKVAMYDNTTGVVQEYVKGIEYTNGQITAIYTEEGRAIPNGTTYNYEYTLKDHLGNNRVRFDINNGMAREIQEDDYYAFGLNVSRYNVGDKDRRLYNSKELQEQLNQYDYGARFYDPVIARWNAPDMLAELSYSLTPYRYCYNNPVNFTDPYGLWETDKNGNQTTNDPKDIERFINYAQSEAAMNVTPNINQISSFVSEEKAGGLGKLTDGSKLLDAVKMVHYHIAFNGADGWKQDVKSWENMWYQVQGDLTPNATDPRTLGHNLFWSNYIGPWNPKTYRGDWDYTAPRVSALDSYAYAHDVSYRDANAEGFMGVVTSTKVIKADYTLVGGSFREAAYGNPEGIAVGVFIGTFALPKTLSYGTVKAFNAASTANPIRTQIAQEQGHL